MPWVGDRLIEGAHAAPRLGFRLLQGWNRGERVRHLEAIGRKTSTTTAVGSTLRVWVGPVLGDRYVARVTAEDVEDLMRTMRTGNLAVKSIRSHIGTVSLRWEHEGRDVSRSVAAPAIVTHGDDGAWELDWV